MQFITVWIKRYLLHDYMSLNDICCYIPTWFGALTTIITGLIAYECTLPLNANQNIISYVFGTTKNNNKNNNNNNNHSSKQRQQPYIECCYIMTISMMSIVPAHLMRSMGGGYDNESVAVAAMVLTFYCWIRSLRSTNTIPITFVASILTGLSYFCMVAAWGGYIFVLNVIGLHAVVLVGLGRFTNKVYIAYTLFYVTGTTLAVQIPVVGWAPLKSLEQLGPCAVFLAYQLLYITEHVIYKQRKTSDIPITWMDAMTLRVQVFGVAIIVSILVVMIAFPTGFFGPLSYRVRALFAQHTKTGNPLVDSVSEHAPVDPREFFEYLQNVYFIAPIGYVVVGLLYMSDSSSFLLVWGAATYFFSTRMSRLIILTAPIGCILGGIFTGRVIAWCLEQWLDPTSITTPDNDEATSNGINNVDIFVNEFEVAAVGGRNIQASISNRSNTKKTGGVKKATSLDGFSSFLEYIAKPVFDIFTERKKGLIGKRLVSIILLLVGCGAYNSFFKYSWQMADELSHPTIMENARTKDGRDFVIDDYRESFSWLRKNTPKDSRVMAWWDYGHQIAAIANRTTIADGNTWNHEHIALLGKILTTDVETGWEMARHLADYVYILAGGGNSWGGGVGDDFMKCGSMVHIANSVYRDHCPNDPRCRAFGVIDRQGTPSAMMSRSLVYRLHGRGRPGVEVPDDKFKEVYRSRYGKVRIYEIIGVSKESKKWVEENRVCDVPGSWFCPGQYPPGLRPFMDGKTDFNRETTDDSRVTQRNIISHQSKGKSPEESLSTEAYIAKLESLKVKLYNQWVDSEEATRMWNLINENKVKELEHWLDKEPHMAFIRSKDGRGPMFWAFEKRNEEITKLLMKRGLPHTDSDIRGLKPADILQKVN